MKGAPGDRRPLSIRQGMVRNECAPYGALVGCAFIAHRGEWDVAVAGNSDAKPPHTTGAAASGAVRGATAGARGSCRPPFVALLQSCFGYEFRPWWRARRV